VTLLSILIALPPDAQVSVLLPVSLAAMAVGVAALVAPWARWPASSTLPFIPLALALIAVGNAAGGEDPYTYAVYFVVLFVWIGMAHPRWTAAKVAPLAAAAYVTPFMLQTHPPTTAIGSVIVAIPVCVLVGETIAGVVGRLRASEAAAARRAVGMEALAEAETTMEAEADQRRIAELATRLAVDILRCEGAAILVAHADGRSRVVAAQNFAVEAALEETGHELRGCLVLEIPTTALPGARLVVSFGGAECPDDGFTEPAARIFATKVARAMEQVQVVEALTDAAIRDGLTGIGNRRHADAMVAGLKPGDAVVLIDLDNFKQVNDAFGHAAGDEVLVAVGRFLRENLRRRDDVARLGGEEFLVVLREEVDAIAAAQRLVERWRHLGQPATISAGVDVHVSGRDPAETLARADRAMYDAKRAGRDTAVAASPPTGGLVV
ncbi:MAG: hypothetical protein QOG87_2266, partial [Actinomycetota bacterium]|jgi:diguanylate cyclase (GGDEF)-like protein